MKKAASFINKPKPSGLIKSILIPSQPKAGQSLESEIQQQTAK